MEKERCDSVDLKETTPIHLVVLHYGRKGKGVREKSGRGSANQKELKPNLDAAGGCFT